MDEISNKTLATLLVVAIVISLAGTFFAMRGVSQVTNIITGAQSASGTAKVNISEQTSITLDANTVDFGTGQRVPTLDVAVECNLTSNASAPACWNATGTYLPGPSGDFVLENTGNVNVNVTINGTVSANFYNSCDTAQIIGGDPKYYWASRTAGTFGANTYTGCESGSVATWTEFTASAQPICSNLTFTNGADYMNVSIRLDVPSGPAGQCEDNGVLFSAKRNY